MSLTQQLTVLRRQPASQQRDQACLALLTQATMTLLGSQRLYGELLVRLPKTLLHGQQAALQLQVKPALTLAVDPDRLLVLCQTGAALTAVLKHVLGHLIWRHLDRYADQTDDPLVQLATDLAVNEYIPDLPKGAFSRSQINFQYHLNLLPKQDSATYLHALNQSDLGQNKRGQAFHSGHDTQLPTVTQLDSHEQWQGTDDAVKAAVDQLLSDAWFNTPEKQRGLLPSAIQQQLRVIQQPLSFNWRQLLQRGLGNAVRLRDDAYNRFDRRQPYRLELPGSRVSTVRTVVVFVDQSGSMSDTEVATVLGQVMTLLKRYQDTLIVVPFDAAVHADQLQRVRHAGQLHQQRFGGGGTAYQPIFNWLLEQGYRDENAVAMILTDGHGEARVDQHRFTNVIWGLTTTVSDLSVHQPIGSVTVIHV